MAIVNWQDTWSNYNECTVYDIKLAWISKYNLQAVVLKLPRKINSKTGDCSGSNDNLRSYRERIETIT